MGRDKRLVELNGETLLDRAVRRLADADIPVTVVGGPPTVPAGAHHLPDDEPGAGPMAGVRTAVRSLVPPLGVVAVDMPDASRVLLDWLAGRLLDVAAVPVVHGVVQPLHAVWGPGARRALDAAWEDGQRSLRRFLEAGAGVARVREADWRPVADDHWWVSLDTPEALAARQAR